jgi:RHS repeat-associated protein
LDAEASGYFLIPAGPLPMGWQAVSEAEGNSVWGKGVPNQVDPTRTRPYDPTTCPDGGGGGLTVASAQLMVCGLHLKDTPLFYTPPKGPAVRFTLTYNQREAGQPTTFTYGNVGNLWTYGWLSYVQEAQSGAPGNYTFTPTVYLMGGGSEPYPSATSSTATLVSYGPQYQMDSCVQLTKANGAYTQLNSDGSSYVYGYLIGSNYFLTQIVDPAGNALTLNYEADNSGRLTSVTDATGQPTYLYYVSDTSTDPGFYLIDHVTEGVVINGVSYQRTCKLGYNTNGQLSSITDVMGLQSQFMYESGDDFINSLITPYGTSTFAWDGINSSGDNMNRWLTLTDPLGNIERVEYDAQSNTSPAGAQPDATKMSTDAGANGECNTFYWDKHAYAYYPIVNDARTYHWLHSAQLNETSGDLENEKLAMESNRVWYNYPGQTDGPHVEGTSGIPTSIGRVLDDGTSQIYQYTYNSLGKVLTATDPLLPKGRVTTYTYAANNIDLTSVTQKNSLSSSGYDILATFSNYNTQHEPQTVIDASGQVTSYSYNAAGQVSTITDAKNEVTRFYYDPAGAANTSDSTKTGYLVAVVGPAVNSPTGPTTTFTYDNYGRVQSVTDSEGYKVTTNYDNLNRPTLITYPDQTTTQYFYTNLDLTKQIDRRGRVTQYRYNPLRQLALVIDPLERNTAYDWCGCGALLALTDAAGNTTAWIYDTQGRKTAKIYPDQTTETYAYETTTSRLKSVTDALNQVTNYTYNVDNSLKQVSYTDTNGNPLNPATPTVGFTYDPNYLRLSSMTDGTGTTNYAYYPVPPAPITTPVTGANQLESVTGPLANSAIGYTYDELGRVLGTSINGSSNSSSVVYDALGRVQSAANPLGNFGYMYVNQTNRLSQMTYPNGQVTAYGYYQILPGTGNAPGNDDLRLQTIANYALNAQHSAYVNVSSFGYAYDAEGIITTWAQQFDTNAPRYLPYAYDLADQLTAAVMPPITSGGSTTSYNYAYDLAGNRTGEQINTAVTGATMNELNQITAMSSTGPIYFAGTIDEPATVTVNGVAAKAAPDASNSNQTDFSANVTLSPGTDSVAVAATNGNNVTSTKNYQVTVANNGVNRILKYDANGNLTNDGNGKVYAYNAANEMISVTQNGTTTGYAYDGMGHRVQETLNGTIVKQWVWCGGVQPSEERDASNNVTKRFYWQGEQIAGANYYFTTDHEGSIREMTNASGALVARYDYDPYGRRSQVLTGGTDLADFGFTNFYYDQATGLDFARWRPYSADLGRWLSRDPIGERGGINLYAYVLNNPINLIDLFGLQSQSDCDLVDQLTAQRQAFATKPDGTIGAAKLLVGAGAGIAKGGTITVGRGVGVSVGGDGSVGVSGGPVSVTREANGSVTLGVSKSVGPVSGNLSSNSCSPCKATPSVTTSVNLGPVSISIDPSKGSIPNPGNNPVINNGGSGDKK